MAEPSSNTASGIALATGTITITGSIFGLQYDALLFGLFGGLISLMHLPPMSLLRLVGTLGSAALFGALFGPAMIAFAAASWSWFSAVPAGLARLGGALLVGLFAQAIVPIALAFLDRKRNAAAGGPP